MGDNIQQLQQAVKAAYADNAPLFISGDGSKRFLALRRDAAPLSTLAHTGIVAYEPTELVITARAGTPLAEVEKELRRAGQMLAFEPPAFGGGGGTVGGALACGLSGPRRPWAGAARDFVLGARIINGKGENLRFGGQVMKNVAGYDVSRLMAGALGVLGLIHEVSFKVLPLPELEMTRVFEQSERDFITFANRLSGQAVPLGAACHVDGKSMIRLSGNAAGVDAAAKKLGGETMADGDVFWAQIRDHTHPFFKGGDNGGGYWRVSVPPAAPPLDFGGAAGGQATDQMIDWGGAQRWVRTDLDPAAVQSAAARAGGHAGLWHGADKLFLRPLLPPALAAAHKKLKAAFDPAGVLNRGVFYPFL